MAKKVKEKAKRQPKQEAEIKLTTELFAESHYGYGGLSNGHRRGVPDAKLSVKKTGGEDKRDKAELEAGDFKNAFNTPHQTTATDYLVNPGELVRNLLMRVYNPSKHTDADIFCVAATKVLSDCRKYHDRLGEEQLLDRLAMTVSDNGLGRDQLVKSIVGQNEFEAKKQVGGLAGLKDWATGGHGRNKDNEQK